MGTGICVALVLTIAWAVRSEWKRQERREWCIRYRLAQKRFLNAMQIVHKNQQ
jgi:hypothetical protein